MHEAVAERFLADLAPLLADVELRADDRAHALLPGALRATDDDWATEFLDLILAVRVVDSIDEAIDHVARYGVGSLRGDRHHRRRGGRPLGAARSTPPPCS